mmetsp:Transcript_12750/g.17786  ORF Transcript_12750/g.17786 Transcript_12750/m.17786 type:complete len:284 (+) Transcript_12750:47-898(+)
MANILIRRMAGLAVSQSPRSLLGASLNNAAPASIRSFSSLSTMFPNRWIVDDKAGDNSPVMMTSSKSFSSTTMPQKSEKKGGAQPHVVTAEDGRQYAIVQTTYRKLKPKIVRRRLEKMKTYEGREQNIRYSPWKMRLLCQLVSGMPLLDALEQLAFNDKSKAPLLHKILKRTSNLADIRDGLQMSQLEIAECFATPGRSIKGIRFLSKGRFGKKVRRHCHVRMVLREIDFPLRIYQSKSLNQKRKWIERQLRAQKDAEAAQAEREELARLEQQAAEKEKEKNK